MVMTAATPFGGDYDDYASQYATNVAWRERCGPDTDPFGLLMPMLELLGDITNRRVLDAGCGEGYLARALAARGAREAVSRASCFLRSARAEPARSP